MGTSDFPLEPWKRRKPDITHELAEATDRIVAARVVTKLQREGRLPPLIEIKGLGNMVADARKSIAEVKSEGAGLTTDATAFVTAVKDVRAQIQQAHSDLKFEAETLGNGGETATTKQGA